MVIIKRPTDKKCWRGCGENGTFLHCWWECKLVQPLWRTIDSFLKKLNIEISQDPAIPLLGIYLDKTIIQREFQNNIYICFIDYTKAFDYTDHNKLWKIPKEMRIPDHLTCLLRNLYAGQEATGRT